MKFHLFGSRATFWSIIGVLSIACGFAVGRIADAVTDYEAYKMDRNASTINTSPRPLLPPWSALQKWEHPQIRPAAPNPYGICDDRCKQRSPAFI